MTGPADDSHKRLGLWIGLLLAVSAEAMVLAEYATIPGLSIILLVILAAVCAFAYWAGRLIRRCVSACLLRVRS